MKSNDLIKMAKKFGWEQDRSKGSHRVFAHPNKSYKVIIPIKNGKDMNPNTFKSIKNSIMS